MCPRRVDNSAAAAADETTMLHISFALPSWSRIPPTTQVEATEKKWDEYAIIHEPLLLITCIGTHMVMDGERELLNFVIISVWVTSLYFPLSIPVEQRVSFPRSSSH